MKIKARYMKCILVLMIFLAQVACGQVKKGALLLGPTLSYLQLKTVNTSAQNSNISNTTKTMIFGSEVRAGYFLTDKIAVGIIGGYSDSKMVVTNKNPNLIVGESFTKINLVSAGLFARSYKMFNENKLGFFGELKSVYKAGASNSGNKSQQIGAPLFTNQSKANVTNFSVGISPGLVYFLVKKLAIEASFGSLSFNTKTTQNYYAGEKTTKTKDSNFSIAFNSVSLGIMFYLSR